MRRLILVLAGLAVLAAGALTAFVVHRLREGGNVRGSPTVEYVPTTHGRRRSRRSAIQWPMYGLDAARTRSRRPARCGRRSGASGGTSAASLVEFPPAIGYGRLFFSTNSGILTAISQKTGKRAWKYRSHRCVAASPALGPHAHGTVYEVFLNRPPCNALSGGHGDDGEVIALSAGHGKVHWRHTIGPSESSPLIVGDTLYVGDWNGDVWAFDANHGRVLWRAHVGGAIKGGIAYAGGPPLRRLLRRARLLPLDERADSSGRRPRSRASSATRTFYSTPAVAYGRVYIGSTDGKVYSFGATTGKLRWSHGTGGYVYASPAVWRQTVFAGSYSGRFYALDAATGDVRWIVRRERARSPARRR